MERAIWHMSFTGCAMPLAAALLLAGCASSGDKPAAQRTSLVPTQERTDTGAKAGQIVTQPARDVGVSKIGIPPILAKASEDPYSLKGLESCTQLATAVKELNEVLGPDFSVGDDKKENRAGKFAEAGGKTIVNALVPFRSLVREITGAAPAQRRLNAAVDAGYARRGFLRGVHSARGCRTTF